ncbi:MAG: ABC transporter ATP-binding protein [Acidobacteria bacterium]|nr:ABC transporter ATP-binding protein [Acidobacteriota bacterium]
MSAAFEFCQTVKCFPGFQLGPLDLALDPGKILAYVGVNGAGKTTTLNCLVGLLKPDAGRITVFGRPNDPRDPAWKQDIGFVGDRHVFYERWSAAENLRFLAGFYPAWDDRKAGALAARLRLPLQRRARDLSAGNRVKLSLVAALAHSPRLLVLDEPTAGLDPVVRQELLDELLEVIQDEERAVFYSTHVLADIRRLADELAFLDEGRVTRRATPADLEGAWRRINFRSDRDDLSVLATVSHRREGREHQVVSEDGAATLAHLAELGVEVGEVSRLGVEEIAVYILRGGRHVAPDPR